MPALVGLYVLIVDDNTGARDSLKVGLRREGALVKTAPNAPEAILTLATVLPDVIITD